MISLQIFTIITLVLIDIYVKPPDKGPDRAIHDPPVYRLWDENYMLNDWFTNFASETKVHLFFGYLINIHHYLGISEMSWRLILYLLSLVILYYSIVRIVLLFSQNLFIVFFIVGIHMVVFSFFSPPGMYGPFIQWYGGFVPRTIAMPLSFLALYFLLSQKRLSCFITLGIATLFHVSNSLVVFILFISVILYQDLILIKPTRLRYFKVIKQSSLLVALYIVFGGLFALYQSYKFSLEPVILDSEKFIWIWVFFRGNWVAISQITKFSLLISILHIAATLVSWRYLREKMKKDKKILVDTIFIVFIGAILLYGVFYLGAFIINNLTLFKLNSFRIIYLSYFICYLLISLAAYHLLRSYIPLIYSKLAGRRYIKISYIILLIIMIVFTGIYYSVPSKLISRSIKIGGSLHDQLVGNYRSYDKSELRHFLDNNNLIVLTPPNMSFDIRPKVVHLKTFGYTNKGLYEWYERMNDVTNNKIESIYQHQLSEGKYSSVMNRKKLVNQFYKLLTKQEVLSLARKYKVSFFLTYKDPTYNLPILLEDSDYIIYDLRN